MGSKVPVVTVDGPSGVGKGTICQGLVARFGWHLLDSGAIYRVFALAALHHNLQLDDEKSLVVLASHLDVKFSLDEKEHLVRVILEGEDVSEEIRTPECSQAASKVASLIQVRSALLERQRSFCQMPGLIADGRDMGTVVFPDADIKIFLTASSEERAKRRYHQLMEKGIDVTIEDVLSDINERDKRDTERAISPLKPAADALTIDTTNMTVEQVLCEIVEQVKQISY